jgi:MoxR-like ATPase
MAPEVMRHRLVLSYEALSDGVTPDAILQRVLEAVPIPEAVPLSEEVPAAQPGAAAQPGVAAEAVLRESHATAES